MAGDYSAIMTEKQAFEILKKYGNANDARIICRHIFNRPENKTSNLESLISSLCARFAVRAAAYKLRRGIPVAKIIGKKWFYGLEFETGRHTLDPRPDSETLVEAVLKGTRNKEQGIRILDLGTGTGNLICSIIKNSPGATGIGIDKSWRAVRVARRNVKSLGLENRIEIFTADFSYSLFLIPYSFDIIISNPPYIAAGDARVDAGALHDPHMALYAGADGLCAYRAISKNTKELLKPGGRIYLEIGVGQGGAVREIFERAGWRFIESKNDLSGTERVLIFNV